MKVESGLRVGVSYVLMVEGKEVDRAESAHPLEFTHGQGELLPAFEAAVQGLSKGDDFSFSLGPEEGYGFHNADNVIRLPLALFEIDGELQRDLLTPGSAVPMQTNDGRTVVGRVVREEPEGIVMDFNHELAGKRLEFSGRVEWVRALTQDEIEAAHYGGCGCQRKASGCAGGHGCCQGDHHGECGCSI